MTHGKTKGKRKMDLSEFIEDKVKRSSYRAVAKKTSVSRGALEAIVNRENEEFPKIGTLARIAEAYDKPLWDVVEMAGADLGLPQNDTSRARRLAQLVARHPQFEAVAKKLIDKIDSNPEYVDGVIAAIAASLNETPDESPQ